MADRTVSRGRRIALAVALATVVTLSGCGFLGGGGGGGDQVAADYVAADGSVNGTALGQAHTDRLRSAETFTSRTNVTVTSDRGRFRIARTVRVDREADAALEAATLTVTRDGNTSTIDADTYTEGETTYRRVKFSSAERSQTSYQDENSGASSVNTTSAMLADLPGNAADANWTRNGTTRVEGVRTARLEASGVDNFGGFRPSEAGNTSLGSLEPNLTSLSGVMLVSDDGVIRRLTIEGEGTQGGQSVTITAKFRITSVGSTTVERPSWYDTAEEETSGQS